MAIDTNKDGTSSQIGKVNWKVLSIITNQWPILMKLFMQFCLYSFLCCVVYFLSSCYWIIQLSYESVSICWAVLNIARLKKVHLLSLDYGLIQIPFPLLDIIDDSNAPRSKECVNNLFLESTARLQKFQQVHLWLLPSRGNLNLHSTPQKQQLDLRDIRSLRKYNFFNLTVSALKMTEMSPTWLSSFLWQSSMTSNCITSENLLTHISCKPPLASPPHGKITEIYCLLVLLVWAGEGSGLKGGVADGASWFCAKKRPQVTCEG